MADTLRGWENAYALSNAFNKYESIVIGYEEWDARSLIVMAILVDDKVMSAMSLTRTSVGKIWGRKRDSNESSDSRQLCRPRRGPESCSIPMHLPGVRC